MRALVFCYLLGIGSLLNGCREKNNDEEEPEKVKSKTEVAMRKEMSKANMPRGTERVDTLPRFTRQTVPESRRSREVMERVGRRLVKEMGERELTFGDPIFVRVFKMERELEIWVKRNGGRGEYVIFRMYKIKGMSGELGPKEWEGDRQAVEGFYYVTARQMNPNSKYHLSFDLGYPNVYDRTHGRTGSALMVHGKTGSIGCFAMGDDGIEEIYTLAAAALAKGQRFFRVHCFAFRMTEENMTRYGKGKWAAFWRNLKEGYDWFEKRGVEPNVRVMKGQYVFD